MDHSEDTASRREALVSNVLAQDAAVDVSASILGADAIPQIGQYRAALRNMKDAIEETTDVVSMSIFWSAASELLVARNELLTALEKRSQQVGS